MSNTILLQANNIHKAYSNHIALNDVSITIKQGSIFGLLGPNGAGKTSLIRIVNQITAPDSGTVLFNNERLQAKHIAHIGYLPEERGLYKQMKVGEQALYLAQLKGLTKIEALKRLKYWFEKFEIESWWNKKVEELSKGMQQKVQFVVTILHQPQLLILDEPFSGFDPINASLLKQEILALKAQGTTIMFSSHNMESVEQLCDDVVLINKAQKVLDGSVIDIKNQYKTNMYSIDFVGSMMGFTNALWTSAEIITKKELPTHNSVTIKTLGKSTLNDVLVNVLSTCQIIGVHEIVPSLNEIFIKTVGSNSLAINEILTE